MWYSAGTVAVTANSATVTGTGTAFSANARVGDAFRGPDGRWYAVTNIASASVISISPAYQGDTATGQTYAIAPIQGYVKDSADRLRQITDQFGTILASLGENGPSIKVDAAGLLADRANYDGRSAGFAYYATDTELLYIKLGGVADSWSLGAPVAVGPPGPTGDVTPEALQAMQSAQDAASASEDSASAAAQYSLAAQQAADAVAAIGAGWTPVLAVVTDGERRVLQVTDWTGGEANKPAAGQYVGPSGFVVSIGDATDVRGATGAGTVDSVSGVLPDQNGNVDLGPEDVGALPQGGTAADSIKLGGINAAEFFRRSNILGTVSQAAGVPTGAIIERGSNANGGYVRYADGTQICIGLLPGFDLVAQGAIFRSGIVGWTFPAAFALPPTCYAGDSSSSVIWGSASAADSTASASVCLFYHAATTGRSARIVAIGRWY